MLFSELERLTSKVSEVETELHRLTGKGGARLSAMPEVAGLLLKNRKARNKMFPGLFTEPAWDILLSLAAMNPAKPDVQISAISYDAEVPPTTALRYLAMLETAGLVERSVHPADRRVVLVRLTSMGRQRLQLLLEKWPLAVVLVAAPLTLLLHLFW
ncbi:MarR family transcriptional regulator [Sphingomonas sp. LT1P40]|uniref:MarR family transcriptional regulator n=1 Tax=Alteristakelama amylovorans TaxID=3096166 RepID=UPI002FCB7A19